MPGAKATRGRSLLAFVGAVAILLLTGLPSPGTIAQLVTPQAGATKVSLSTIFQWTSVVNAQAYYLYVGTAPGAKDVVNTGETLSNSYTAKKLPEGRTLYARIWTKQSSSWSYLDSTFSTLVLRASLTAPADGASGVPLSTTFEWTPADNAQVYYLYVGTAPGTNDVVNSGEITQTSLTASNLPEGRTLYARIWTKANGAWNYLDTSFTTISLVARVSSPVNGAVVAAAPITVQWAAVPNVQAYYLYGGTTAGAKDLINTGEIAQTSVTSATALPSEKTIYLRLWTKIAGVWRYSDSIVTTTGTKSTLIAPANGAAVFPVGAAFQWGPVAGVQAYYLYVGTVAGANDVVNTGEIQTTTHTVTLPEDTTLYVRLWTKRSNIWQYSDSTLTTTSTVARVTAPVNNQTGVPLTTTFQWTSVPGSQAYYLYVGTTPGSTNVVNTGEIQQTSHAASNLPQGQTLYVRMWTKTGGAWRSTDSAFSTLSLVSQLTTPADGAQEVPLTTTFGWNAVPGADRHYLYVGRTAGAADVVDSGETPNLSYTAALPEYTQLYARLWTRAGGTWRSSDSSFRTTRTKARFVYPTDKAIGVDLGRAIEWTPVSGAEAYRLTVFGAADGSSPYIDSGETTATAWPAQGLPSDRPLFARLWSRIEGTWRFTDAIFTAQAAPAASQIVSPAPGSLAAAAGVPFQWSEVPVAGAYRLEVGSSPGTHDLHDSGSVSATRRFVDGLPAGVTLYGRLSTLLGSNWVAQDFTFAVADPSITTAQRLAFAEWANGEVRRMAAPDNTPAIGSELASVVSDLNYGAALCTDYSAALVAFYPDLNLGLTIRRLDVGFLNIYDAHTLNEVFDPDTGRWVILDPTFGLSARRAWDGAWASAEDLQAATASGNWEAIGWAWQTSSGDAYVRGYYLDYPLLFLSVFHQGTPFAESATAEIDPYVEPIVDLVSDDRSVYLVQCGGGAAGVSVFVDGEPRAIACSVLNGFSAAFYATTVEMAPGNSAAIYRLRRFVF